MRMLKALWLVMTLLVAGAAGAQSRVIRCQDADGHWVFQSQPCGQGLSAPVPPVRTTPENEHPFRPGAAAVPGHCDAPLAPFLLADPALDGVEFRLNVARDAGGYQIVLKLGGAIEREDGPVPAQFSEQLGRQGLRFDGGALIAPDFRRGDKELGYGYARSATLLDQAMKSEHLEAEVEPRGYAQPLLSAPVHAALLVNLRTEVLRCHLARERADALSKSEHEQRAREGQPRADAP